MNDAGRIGFVIRDDYDNNVQYDFLDVVYYHGNSYVAKKLTLGNIPNENNEYWHILAAGGVRVKGDAETEYRDGDVNITKADIGLRETENKSSETIRSEITSENVTDALGYTPIKGIKGNAESTYRTGEVNLTPENIGLGNVDNTSDADKPISTAQREEFNKKVNKTDIMQGSTATTPGKAGLVPAPSVGDEGKMLMGDGEFKNIYSAEKLLNTSGWYRFVRWEEYEGTEYEHNADTASLCGVVNISRRWTNTKGESYVIVVSSAQNKGFTFHLLNCTVNEKMIPKIRATKLGKICYLECQYSESANNWIAVSSYLAGAAYNKSYRTFQSVDFEPATEDETILSEYTIPEKDDFDTSKSLTRFEEIPEGADLNSEKYAVPGNYMCSSNDVAQTLKNCPFNLAFTMTVKYGNGFSDYCIQTFEIYRANVIAKRFRNSKKEWETPLYYYPSVGTPPANKLWGTDANGNVGWIDPP